MRTTTRRARRTSDKWKAASAARWREHNAAKAMAHAAKSTPPKRSLPPAPAKPSLTAARAAAIRAALEHIDNAARKKEYAR